jgi:hypothetical protein
MSQGNGTTKLKKKTVYEDHLLCLAVPASHSATNLTQAAHEQYDRKQRVKGT